jgi:hypothetical protein
LAQLLESRTTVEQLLEQPQPRIAMLTVQLIEEPLGFEVRAAWVIT